MADEALTIYLRHYAWWQSPIDAALALVKVAGFEVDHTQINADNGSVQLWFKLPPGLSEKAAYNKLVGWSGASDVPVTLIAEAVVEGPPSTPPPPPAPPQGPWWAALKVGDRVKLARTGVKIYYDPSPTANVWNALSDGRTMDVFGVSGDYIQVKQYPPFNLWVAAGDVVKA